MKWTESVSALVAVVLDEKAPENTSHPLPGVNAKDIYLVLGEVSYHDVVESGNVAIHDRPILRGIRHYVLLELSSGRILPGMYHAERFRAATEDEL